LSDILKLHLFSLISIVIVYKLAVKDLVLSKINMHERKMMVYIYWPEQMRP